MNKKENGCITRENDAPVVVLRNKGSGSYSAQLLHKWREVQLPV